MTPSERKEKILEKEAKARKNTSANFRNLRTEALNFSQGKMCEMLGDYSKAQYSELENGNTLPQRALIELLREELLANPKYRRLSNFSTEDFYSRIIDFENLKKPFVNELFEFFRGSYISYFYDFSDVRYDSPAKSPLKISGMVLYIYEHTNSAGMVELAVCGIRFKEVKDAHNYKDKLDAYMSSAKEDDVYARLTSFIDTSIPKIEPNNLFVGSLKFLRDEIFKITLTNRTREDEPSLLFLVPPLKRQYIGGLGIINSVSRGIYQLPTSQRIIISRSIPEIDPETLGKHLRAKNSDIPVDAQFMAAIESHEKIRELASSVISPAEMNLLLAHKLKRLIDLYNSQINFSGIRVTPEEENEVYHILKHFAKKK